MKGITAFFTDVLRAPPRNVQWSWGAIAPQSGSVYLKVWDDQIQDGPDGKEVMVFYYARHVTKHGSRERQRHLKRARAGAPLYGIVCRTNDISALPRSIDDYDDSHVLVLGKLREDAEEGVTWAHIEAEVDLSDHVLSRDTKALNNDIVAVQRDFPDATTRDAMIAARLGQGRFRSEVLENWEGACAVTGCSVLQAIRASHIRPWCMCDNEQRLDKHNGLPLVAQLDALFDVGLITFDEGGNMHIARALSRNDCRGLDALGQPLRHQPTGRTGDYLEWHREHAFQDAR